MDSVLREEEVVTVLENDLGKEFRLKEFTVKLASDNLTGFLGEHYMLEVQIQGQPRTLSYFVKKIPTRVPEHSEYALKTGAFYKEVELYKTLFVDMKNSQSNKEKPTKWHPECFYTREHDLFVLENLTEAGYYMYPRTKLMDEDHIKSSLRAMAAMHAASIVFEEKFNQKTLQSLSGVQLDPTQSKVTVGDVYSNLTFETEASDVKGHPGNTFHEAGIQSQLEIVRLLPEYTAEEQKLIADKLPKILRHFLQLVKTSDK